MHKAGRQFVRRAKKQRLPVAHPGRWDSLCLGGGCLATFPWPRDAHGTTFMISPARAASQPILPECRASRQASSVCFLTGSACRTSCGNLVRFDLMSLHCDYRSQFRIVKLGKMFLRPDHKCSPEGMGSSNDSWSSKATTISRRQSARCSGQARAVRPGECSMRGRL